MAERGDWQQRNKRNFFVGGRNVLDCHCIGTYNTISLIVLYTKTNDIIQLKLVNFIVCKSYLCEIDMQVPRLGGNQKYYFIQKTMLIM